MKIDTLIIIIIISIFTVMNIVMYYERSGKKFIRKCDSAILLKNKNVTNNEENTAVVKKCKWVKT